MSDTNSFRNFFIIININSNIPLNCFDLSIFSLSTLHQVLISGTNKMELLSQVMINNLRFEIINSPFQYYLKNHYFY